MGGTETQVKVEVVEETGDVPIDDVVPQDILFSQSDHLKMTASTFILVSEHWNTFTTRK